MKQERLDALYNLVTKLGVTGSDKSNAMRYQVLEGDRLTRYELEDLYYQEGISSTIVDALPDDMLRNGFEFTLTTAAETKALEKKLKRLHLKDRLGHAMRMARLYGGAVLVLGVNDGEEASRPINWGNLRNLNWINVLHRYEIQVYKRDRNPLSGTFGRPYSYQLMGGNFTPSKVGTIIHSSRVIRFVGQEIPESIERRLEIEGGRGFGSSVLQRAWGALKNLLSSYGNTTTLIQEFNQAIYQIENLAELLGADGGEDLLIERLRTIQHGRSIINAMILDKSEQFTTNGVDIRGLGDILHHFILHLSAVTRTPVTRLFGREPSGMNATGESDAENWNKYVAAEQESVLREPLEQLAKLVFRSKAGPFGGNMPEKWNLEFLPLDEPSEQDKTDTRSKQAATDQVYYQIGALSSDEIRQSRFGGEAYSIETKLSELPSLSTGEEEDPESLEDPLSEPLGEPAEAEAETEPAKEALNGAQIGSLIEIIEKTQAGLIPRDAAIGIIKASFPSQASNAEALLGSAGASLSYVPESQPTTGVDAEPEVETSLPPEGEAPMSPKDIGQRLGVNPGSIRTMFKQKKIRGWQINGRLRFLLSEVANATRTPDPNDDNGSTEEGQ